MFFFINNNSAFKLSYIRKRFFKCFSGKNISLFLFIFPIYLFINNNGNEIDGEISIISENDSLFIVLEKEMNKKEELQLCFFFSVLQNFLCFLL